MAAALAGNVQDSRGNVRHTHYPAETVGAPRPPKWRSGAKKPSRRGALAAQIGPTDVLLAVDPVDVCIGGRSARHKIDQRDNRKRNAPTEIMPP